MSILFIGVGYAGGKAVDELNKLDLPDVNCLAIGDYGIDDFSCPKLNLIEGENYLPNDRPDFGEAIAERSKEEIKELIEYGVSGKWIPNSNGETRIRIQK